MNKAPKTIQDVAAAFLQNEREELTWERITWEAQERYLAQKAREDRIDAAVRRVFQNSYSRMGKFLRYCTDHNATYTPSQGFGIKLTIEMNTAEIRQAYRNQS